MNQFKKELKDILENDPLNLLDIKPKASNVISADKRLINSFEEINLYYQEKGNEPGENSNIEERKLYSRLKGIREDIDKVEALREYDRFSLLKDIVKEDVKTIDDILEKDTLGLLDKQEDDIFDLKHVPKEKDMPDYIASRKPCKDFEEFEHLFKQCHLDLSSGKRILRPFQKETYISKGNFFILRGIMVYVARKGEKESSIKKANARLRCIFENGTESNMLLRSLATGLYRDSGHRVTEHEDNMLDSFKGISSEDEESGFIYIAKSESNKEEIKNIKNLYKIGYSTTSSEKRVQGAENDPTFLMSSVSIVSEFQCFNMNSQKLELLLHRFFAKSCLDMEIKDSQGKSCCPREWFVVPLPVIEEAIHLLMDGSIIKYEYDPKTQTIVRKK